MVSKKEDFFFLIGKNRHSIGKKVAIFDWEWGRNSAPREEQKIPCNAPLNVHADLSSRFKFREINFGLNFHVFVFVYKMCV